MSRKRIQTIQLTDEILKYCPKYRVWDQRARAESKDRIHEHLQGRKSEISKCVEAAMDDIQCLGIDVAEDAPIFIDDTRILHYAADETMKQINKWDGVQIKQCKKTDDKGNMIMIDTWQKFAKKAKNHQDQTSWKISGDYFFAPYIGKARCFIEDYCQFITNCNETQLCHIRDLANLSFANALFHGEIKFHRTKPKPLIRHRTLVKSNGIHIELEKLHPALTVRQFIQQAKNERKERDGKSNIIAGEFFVNLRKKVLNEYNKQKQRVYQMFNLQFDGIGNDNGNGSNSGMFDDNKDTDIDDDDHSVRNRDEQENQDIDMMNEDDSDSATPSINNDGDNESIQSQQQQGVHNVALKRKKRTKGKHQRAFQSTKMDQHKQKRKNNTKSKQNRAKKIEENCQQKKRIYKANNNGNNGNNGNIPPSLQIPHNATPPNTLSMTMNNINNMNSNESSFMFDNTSVINTNTANYQANDCSDCHSITNNASSINNFQLFGDDRTTISTVSNQTPMTPMPSAANSVSVSLSMSPMRIPINNNSNSNNMMANLNGNVAKYNYQPTSYPHAPQNYEPSMLTPCDHQQQRAQRLQSENDAMRREIQQMRFLLSQKAAHFHQSMTRQTSIQRQGQRPRYPVPVPISQQFGAPIRSMPIPSRVHPQYQHQQRISRRNHQNYVIPARPPTPSQSQPRLSQPAPQYQVTNNDLPPVITMTTNDVEEDEKVLFPDGTQVILENTNTDRNDDEFTTMNINGFPPNNGLQASVEPSTFAFDNNQFDMNQSIFIPNGREESPDFNSNNSSFLNLHYNESSPGL